MFTTTIIYKEGDIETEEFNTLESAKRYAREECAWENTRYATIRNGHGTMLEKIRGDFYFSNRK